MEDLRRRWKCSYAGERQAGRMILVDTSIWVTYLRKGNVGLDDLLNYGPAVYHPFIIGELACGNLKNRSVIFSLLQTLRAEVQAEHEGVMTFLERHRLMGKGLSYVDMHLLVSSVLSNIPLWILDKGLREVSKIFTKAC